jgi:hypothetical protein
VTDGFGNGIPSATISVTGSQTASTTSDVNGNYSVSGLAVGGSYTVSASKSGQFTSFARQINNLAGDANGIDVLLSPFVILTIHTVDSTNANLPAVAITITSTSQVASPITNAVGNLNIHLGVPIVDGIQFTITPYKLGYGFNPASFTFNSQAGNQSVTFTALAPNPMDDARVFVRQQYLDFLGREPDHGGWDYWTDQITRCGSDPVCFHNRRIDVSAAFFIELEFQKTGSFVYRLFKGGLGRAPTFTEFTTDRAQVIDGPNLESTKQALTLAFVQRAEFVTKYNTLTTADAFVDALIANIQQNSNVNLIPQRQSLITAYNGGGDEHQRRALALRAAIDTTAFTDAEFNPSFVQMQYMGYLVRDPELGGYLFWLDVLNNRVPGNFRGMVCAFITSAEYQHRFGASVTRTDRDCGQ